MESPGPLPARAHGRESRAARTTTGWPPTPSTRSAIDWAIEHGARRQTEARPRPPQSSEDDAPRESERNPLDDGCYLESEREEPDEPPLPGLRVVAVRRGQYHGVLRRPGTVFDLAQGGDFNPNWMEVAPKDARRVHITPSRVFGQIRSGLFVPGKSHISEPVTDEDGEGRVVHEFDPFA